ncbi:flagellar hook capping FlgD N-terminal domain-containing protein [Chachezhania antarctica]|uniref:flagellar hook capping FlgD N-terminal domain-containing protein n=1 Tax=Chachezhania antarctica TaxID=2340860 RepID=UPI000EB33803|nr:flagellar hook capping FlgD N-terminal domain-containing protein [Chachezhania antarctica]|tara:strand:+ start:1119 stop:1808 length:690 start_codon:yes stop_codon:yes gene_type:complete
METTPIGPQPHTRAVIDTGDGAPKSTALGAGTALASDFETFLKMLTAQAKYQDPLEPIDSTEYASQLAQFSMVEQQVKTNDALSGLISATGTGNLAALASWVGMEVRADVPVSFNGTPVTVVPAIEAGADRAELVVHDSFGVEVQRSAIGLTGEPVDWAGASGDGTPFPAGTYTFTVESFAQDSLLGTKPAESYALVEEAQIEGGTVMLVLDGGESVAASDVSSVRRAG